MTKICYVAKNFHGASMAIIETANEIIEEYENEGYQLTLRQLYYQFVARDIIPNDQKSYNRLGYLISDARLAGLISWTAIEDTNRNCEIPYYQPEMEEVFSGIQFHYSPDLWENQENYIEIWVEKDALSGVIERPANRWRLPYLACRGYLSSSEAWRAAMRFQDARRNGKYCHLIHLGDHDPSGIDMTRDNDERLETFGVPVNVHRIALNYDQVQQYSPPSNPTKLTDTRASDYIKRFGNTSWELDALKPSVIDNLIEQKIIELTDVNMFNEAVKQLNEKREVLRWIEANHDRVFDFANFEMNEENEG